MGIWQDLVDESRVHRVVIRACDDSHKQRARRSRNHGRLAVAIIETPWLSEECQVELRQGKSVQWCAIRRVQQNIGVHRGCLF